MTIEEDVPLAPFTTFGIGGPAQFFVRIGTTDALQKALSFAKEKRLKIFILGGGSNVLISDTGFSGLVIKIELSGVEEKENTFIAAAGERWDALAERAVQKGLWGIENLSGIPGTVGGAVVQNIGAYGQALSQTLTWVDVFDTHTNSIKKFTREACAFGYRQSIFKKEEHYVILRAAFTLSSAATPDLSYKDLAQRFANSTPSIEQIRDAVLEIRSRKFPNLSQEGTAGSFFKNPILPQKAAQALAAQYPGMPLFALPESSDIKIPLAWLLDHALHLHGTRSGHARLFEAQPLVIAAQKGASSNDVQNLAHLVQEKVKNICGIDIEPEVKIL